MDDKTINVRVKAVRRELRSRSLDALIVTTSENVSYLTGFTGHDSWVVVFGRSVFLITDSRYSEQAEKECFGCKIVQRTDGMVKTAAQIIAKYRSVRRIGIESKCSLAVFGALKKLVKLRFKTVNNIVESVRQTKSVTEVRAIRSAAKIAWGALDATLSQLRVGMSEEQMAGLVDYQMRMLGGVVSFDTIIAYGANGSRPHHQPGRRKLRKNDSILIDFGAKYKGYCCDITRCFLVGKVNAYYERVYNSVLEAQQVAIGMIKEGVRGVDIDAAAKSVLERANLPVFGHGTGHGLGLEVHEQPVVTKKSKGVLKAGDVITIEPGVYIPGKIGIRIEDDILVTKGGFKVLSRDNRFGFSELKLRRLTVNCF